MKNYDQIIPISDVKGPFRLQAIKDSLSYIFNFDKPTFIMNVILLNGRYSKVVCIEAT